ncbi:MAG: cell division protein ZapE [Wenzhouxiangellaceae bacterium]|nr:cell division protein ZapE [Wenzhouxiangellaceae bacterium]
MTDGGRFQSDGAEGPARRYQVLVDAGKLKPDAAQLCVARQLQQCFEALVAGRGGWLRRPKVVPGLYIHGGVGRGKTLLMDLFVQSLEQAGIAVERAHFHRFMDNIHARLKGLGRRAQPLEAIAADQRQRMRVICFDEFHVEDIADAMLLGGLTGHWFERGLTLIATSNSAPDELYAGGLQRQQFLPAIEDIKRNCGVVELDAAEDFRLRELKRHPTWYTPCGAHSEQLLAEEFADLCPDQPVHTGVLQVRGRKLPIRQRSGSVLWCDFSQLCEGPRSAADYIELTCRFSTLILGNIPCLDDARNNAARRFIHLIDECHDRAVKLIASAETAIDAVYQGSRLSTSFERTRSRLVEMQTSDYLALPHRR